MFELEIKFLSYRNLFEKIIVILKIKINYEILKQQYFSLIKIYYFF
jgi:hypothetical protein